MAQLNGRATDDGSICAATVAFLVGLVCELPVCWVLETPVGSVTVMINMMMMIIMMIILCSIDVLPQQVTAQLKAALTHKN